MKAKRGVDIVAGSVLAVLALPMIVVLAVGCAASLRTWPFFVQRRVGKDGRLFVLPKLRTLPRNTPRAVDKYELHRTRIPAFCQFLRRMHIDELPQLLVVPFGWMSLVGPRPEMPTVLERYPTGLANARAKVRPGCTGLWQVSNASGQLIYEAPEFDLAYVHNSALVLDAWILYRTVLMWITGRGSVGLDDIPKWAWYRWAASPTLAFSREAVEHGALVAVPEPQIDLTVLNERDSIEAPTGLPIGLEMALELEN